MKAVLFAVFLGISGLALIGCGSEGEAAEANNETVNVGSGDPMEQGSAETAAEIPEGESRTGY
ncbi:MAG: hypothetical protein ACOCX1_02330 [Fimbriimonadaceae bacterium]